MGVHYEAKLCTILCLYVPGFQKLIFKHVPKCKGIPLTKLPWIPRTYECNLNFVSKFVVSRIPQQAKIANCSGIPQNVSGFRNFKRIQQTVSGFRTLFKTELAYEQLKARAGILISNKSEFYNKDCYNHCQRNQRTRLKTLVT